MEFQIGMKVRFKPMEEQEKIRGGTLDFIRRNLFLLDKTFAVCEIINSASMSVHSEDKDCMEHHLRMISIYKARFIPVGGSKEEVE